MGPYARWMHDSFKEILVNSCDEYMQSSDRGTDKTRSNLIARVSTDITNIAKEKKAAVPDDLEKVILHFISHPIGDSKFFQCVRTWFGNYASGHSKNDRAGTSKADTRGHPTSTRTWTAKSVCGYHYSKRVSEEHKKLSEGVEKNIGKYHAALSMVFNELTEAEQQRCERDAAEWNSKPLPDDVQQK